MKNAKIIDIIKVSIDDVLIELYFNINKDEEYKSLKISITDDGESIQFLEQQNWVNIEELNYNCYSALSINKDDCDSELIRLLKDDIIKIYLGIGHALDTNENMTYYFKLEAKKNKFLFFNNGDKGHFSFDNIDEILDNDIYGYEWTEIVI